MLPILYSCVPVISRPGYFPAGIFPGREIFLGRDISVVWQTGQVAALSGFWCILEFSGTSSGFQQRRA
ncbi:MAG: hypothetical protein HRT63_13345 [Erythrobacter sp.]|nr:hypothetical protein [Erythrobacter sp.]